MSNTLTNLFPTMYAALDVVSREMIGFIPAVSRESTVERAALNQSVLVPVAPATTLADNTPGVTAPNTGDQTIGTVEITISKSKHAPIRWNGEETRGMNNAGTYGSVLQQQFEQAFRAITNAVEVDLASTYTFASRAYGATNATPFATANDLSDIAGALQILDDNGAPIGDRQLVVGTAAMANIRGKQSSLFKVNEAGTEDLLRRGTIGMLESANVFYSGQVARHTAGTADATYDVDLLAGYAVGDTAIHLDTGAGTHVAGDLFVAAGDTNKYIIGTGAAGDGDKDIVLNAPGLRQTLADGVSIGASAAYRANMLFHRSAIQLAARLPSLPDGGDMADDRTTITDPRSGLTFEVAIYRQYRQIHIEVALAWGWKAIKPAHISLLIGQA